MLRQRAQELGIRIKDFRLRAWGKAEGLRLGFGRAARYDLALEAGVAMFSS